MLLALAGLLGGAEVGAEIDAGVGAGVAPAQSRPATGLIAADPVYIATVESDLTLVTQSGQRLRLEGLTPPFRPFFLRPGDAWPWLRRARQALARQTAWQALQITPVRLADGAPARDRYDRLRVWAQPAGAHPDPDRSLQARLLAQGLGRVFPLPDARQGLTALLRVEAEARQTGRGVWRSWPYRVLAVDEARKGLGSFALVQGRVKSVAGGTKATYLNFGEDWRRDFTLRIPAEGRRLFEEAGLAPASLTGRRLRARGWLFYQNGVMLELRQPEQIELLD